MHMDVEREIKKTKLRILFVFFSILSGIIYLFSYIAYFGLEYEHRFRDGYVGTTSLSKLVGLSAFVGFILLVLVVYFIFNKQIKGLSKRLVVSIKQTLIILIIGFIISLPLMYPAYMVLI